MVAAIFALFVKPDQAPESPEVAPDCPELAPWQPQPASGRPQGGTAGQMDRRTYVQIPPVFYRTSSPSGVEVQNGKVEEVERKDAEV